MQWLIACVLVIAIVAVYFPLAYIRLTNKILETLKQIEANTRNP